MSPFLCCSSRFGRLPVYVVDMHLTRQPNHLECSIDQPVYFVSVSKCQNMRKAEDKKLQLLDTGAILLSQHGYNGVGLKEVLEECRVPKGSFYHYFKSKEDYVAQVVEHYQHSYDEMLEAYIAKPGISAVDKIRGISLGVIKYIDAADNRVGCLLGSLTAEVAGSNEGVRKAVAKAYDHWKQHYYPLFEQAQQAGDIRDDISAQQLADTFWNQWQGALLRMQIEQSSEILEQSLALFLDTLYKPE